MSTLRSKFISALAVLFCALLLLSVALMIPKNKSAEAYANSPNTTISELYVGDANGFSAKNLTTLYGKLVPTATNIGDVKDSLDINAEIAVANKEIIVEFGGMKWLAVYLSKATTAYAGTDGPDKGNAADGDVVLTLWLANSVGRYKFSTWANATNQESYTYPGNLYGTSYMRSVVLGNGGQYWNGSALVTESPQTTFSDLIATSTSTSTTQSKGDFLVAPRYISWQYQQSAKALISYENDLNNEAWGPGIESNFKFVSNKRMYFGNLDKYSDWKDDLIWIPSVTEAGYGLASNGVGGTNGIWNTSAAQRKSQSSEEAAWLRSCDEAGPAKLYCVDATVGDQNNGGWIVRYPNIEMEVRPAIHLNLTKAAESTKSVSYDNVVLHNVDASSSNVANNENDHIFAHVYDGATNTVSVTLVDHDNLEQVGTTPDGATYLNGVFSATYPDDHDDKTYTITVKPKTGYVWYDNDNPDEERTYSIKIEATPINTTWSSAITGNLNGSLLQETSKITSAKFTSGVTFTQYFYKVEPNVASKSLPDNPTWTKRNDSSVYFKATQAGLYYMYYKIEAQYHKTTTVTFYTVNVSSDTIHFNLNGDIEVKQTFGDYSVADLKSNLKGQIESWVSDGLMTVKGEPSGKVYTGDDLSSLLTQLEIVVLDDSAEAKPTDGHNYYNAGTYNLGLQYSDNVSADNRTLNFEWDNGKCPTLTIEKKKIAVDIVAVNIGDSLKHVYGSYNNDLMTYKISATLPNGENIEDLKLRKDTNGKYVFRILKDDGTVGDELNNNTPAGMYRITGTANTSNYEIEFEPVTYKVTKLKVTLQVADETVEYGTDFASHTYNDLKKTVGDLVNGDTLSKVIKSKIYSLYYLNGFLVEDAVPAIGEYELRVEVTSDNYEFEYVYGKLTITKANYDMTGVKLESKGYIYNGEAHAASISGTLPSGEITVTYKYVNYNTGEDLDGPPTEVGLYIVYASFAHDNPNYNPIIDKAAYIRIAYTQDELNQGYPDLPTDEQLAAAADLVKKKQEAKKSLDEEANKKKAEIDGNEELTDEEKAKAKSEVDRELEKGNAAIDSATNVSDVNTAFNEGKANIENIKGIHKENSSFPWWIIAVAVGLLLAVAVVIVVVKKRQTADGDDDYYDDFDDEYDFDEEEYEEDFGDEDF